jgi:anion-transporting  ArsA/GET3 family ATPase
MSVVERMAGKRICICTGSGGVGKTTTAAAIAIGLAARGQRVAVVTIDPARRLANALGLHQLGNEPSMVEPGHFARHGLELPGELWAMMLDSKRTFGDLIDMLAPDASTRDEILANRIYQELSSAVAGSQEFTAVAKLYEPDVSGRFDAIVLDTPPSRNALDFLDAPQRLTGFLEGRALKVLTAPTGAAAKLAARASGVVFSALRHVTGVDLPADLSAFFLVLSGVVDGFAERARAVDQLLSDPRNDLPHHHLARAGAGRGGHLLPPQAGGRRHAFGGLIVNRLRVLAPTEPAIDQRVLTADLGGDGELAARSVRALRDLRALAQRDAASLGRLVAELDDEHPILVPQLDREVSDVAGLVTVERFLFAQPRDRSAMLSAQAF